MNPSDPAVRETQVSSQMTNLYSTIEKLLPAIASLEERLCIMLRSSPGEMLSELKKDLVEPEMVGHAKNLKAFNKDITKALESINSILARLEI